MIGALVGGRDEDRSVDPWAGAAGGDCGDGGTLRDDLPDVVRAFAERGLAGEPPGLLVRPRQNVEMVPKPGAGWQPMRARQVIGIDTAGFVWVAEMTVGPIALVKAIDAFGEGRGMLDIRVLGAWRMGVSQGPDADRAEAARYLAELPWSPDAILLNRDLIWSETADGVEVALDTAGGEARVAFYFDAAGDIVRITAKDRAATQPDGSVRLLDWAGHFSDYGMVGGRACRPPKPASSCTIFNRGLTGPAPERGPHRR